MKTAVSPTSVARTRVDPTTEAEPEVMQEPG